MCQYPSVTTTETEKKDHNNNNNISNSSNATTTTRTSTTTTSPPHQQRQHQTVTPSRLLSILFVIAILAFVVATTENKIDAAVTTTTTAVDGTTPTPILEEAASLLPNNNNDPTSSSVSSPKRIPVLPPFLKRFLSNKKKSRAVQERKKESKDTDESPDDDDTAVTTPTQHTKQRGKVLCNTITDPSQVDVNELYHAYKEIQQEYYERAFSSATKSKWKLLTDYDNVQVSLMDVDHDPTCPYVKMTTVIDVSVEECWEFLQLSNWHVNMPKMDPFYESVKIYGEYTYTGDTKKKLMWGGGRGGEHHDSVHMILAKKQTKRIITFGKRDFVFLSVSDMPLQDGTMISGTVSIHLPSLIPKNPSEGYTRAYQDSIAFYKPLNDNTQTQITIICRIDLNDNLILEDDESNGDGGGGLIPMWLYVKTIGVTGNKSVRTMRDVLVEAKHEREQAAAATAAAIAAAAEVEESLITEQSPNACNNQRRRIPSFRRPFLLGGSSTKQ